MVRESPRGWISLDHTADLGFRAWGPTLDALFEAAAQAVASLAVDLRGVRPAEIRRVRVEGIDAEELLVSWLQELLYLWTPGGFIGCRFEVKTSPPRREEADEGRWSLVADVAGEPWDPARHEAFTDIKAATYHNLEIHREASRFSVDMILDI